MKKNIIILLILLPIISLSQSNKHNVFGINLDLDWYSLTNQQTFAYSIQDHDINTNFVITDCDYVLNKIEAKFLKLGFKELLLLFPKGFKGKLDDLKPEMFLARIRYIDNVNYANKSNNDISKILSILNEEYGEPELNMIRDKYSVYKWKGVYYKIVLTCREDELTTTLIYKKD